MTHDCNVKCIYAMKNKITVTSYATISSENVTSFTLRGPDCDENAKVVIKQAMQSFLQITCNIMYVDLGHRHQ